jgi:hypothetical protein
MDTSGSAGSDSERARRVARGFSERALLPPERRCLPESQPRVQTEQAHEASSADLPRAFDKRIQLLGRFDRGRCLRLGWPVPCPSAFDCAAGVPRGIRPQDSPRKPQKPEPEPHSRRRGNCGPSSATVPSPPPRSATTREAAACVSRPPCRAFLAAFRREPGEDRGTKRPCRAADPIPSRPHSSAALEVELFWIRCGRTSGDVQARLSSLCGLVGDRQTPWEVVPRASTYRSADLDLRRPPSPLRPTPCCVSREGSPPRSRRPREGIDGASCVLHRRPSSGVMSDVRTAIPQRT